MRMYYGYQGGRLFSAAVLLFPTNVVHSHTNASVLLWSLNVVIIEGTSVRSCPCCLTGRRKYKTAAGIQCCLDQMSEWLNPLLDTINLLGGRRRRRSLTEVYELFCDKQTWSVELVLHPRVPHQWFINCHYLRLQVLNYHGNIGMCTSEKVLLLLTLINASIDWRYKELCRVWIILEHSLEWNVECGRF